MLPWSAGAPCLHGRLSSNVSRDSVPMLHPKQFEVNEAWLAFKLNELPICTELEGEFNCIALMDEPAHAADPLRRTSPACAGR